MPLQMETEVNIDRFILIKASLKTYFLKWRISWHTLDVTLRYLFTENFKAVINTVLSFPYLLLGKRGVFFYLRLCTKITLTLRYYACIEQLEIILWDIYPIVLLKRLKN